MIIENNVRKAYAWSYVESIIKGLYGDRNKEVLKVVKVLPHDNSKMLTDMEFLNTVWSRVDIVEHITNSKGRHPYNLISAVHGVEMLPDNWIKHHFYYVDVTEGFKADTLTFTIIKSSHLSKTDRLTAHRKLFELFKSVTGGIMLMTILGNLKNYILSANDIDFGSEL